MVGARLTFGAHCCTRPREERCGRRTNPVKSTCTSTTPQLSERAAADPSELAAKVVLRARRLCCLKRGAAFSPNLHKLDLIEVLSALLRGGAQIVGGVLELAYYRAAEDGRLPPQESVTGF